MRVFEWFRKESVLLNGKSLGYPITNIAAEFVNHITGARFEIN